MDVIGLVTDLVKFFTTNWSGVVATAALVTALIAIFKKYVK